jgi:outer membrane protein TolC
MELENEKRKVAADINSGYATLSVLLGENVAPNTELVIDIEERFLTSTKLNRPESALYEKQRVSVRAQKELIDRMDKPQIILFGQAGLAYPNRLNFSKIELAPFALGGIGLSYKLSDKSDKSIKKQKLILHENLIDIREETFEHQLEVQKSGYAEKFQSLNYQIDQYEKIAELQAEILSQLQIQLDNGVITSTDYLIQANAELLARQNLELTKVRLKQKELEYFNIIGQKN